MAEFVLKKIPSREGATKKNITKKNVTRKNKKGTK
jgi:hypothetical protein